MGLQKQLISEILHWKGRGARVLLGGDFNSHMGQLPPFGVRGNPRKEIDTNGLLLEELLTTSEHSIFLVARFKSARQGRLAPCYFHSVSFVLSGISCLLQKWLPIHCGKLDERTDALTMKAWRSNLEDLRPS